MVSLGFTSSKKTDQEAAKSVKGLNTSSESSNQESFEVKSVIDGDTIIISTGESVRLTGINAPEENQPYYKEAKEELAKLVDGKKVGLKYDVVKKDSYGRLLAYVYLDSYMINNIIIQKGLGVVETVPPNVTWASEFVASQNQARANCSGIWEGLCKQNATSCIQISNISKNEEWVELVNTCSEVKSLKGYLLKDSSASNSYEFSDLTVSPHGKVKLHSGCGESTSKDVYWICPERSTSIWNNTGDRAYLFDPEGKLVSELGY